MLEWVGKAIQPEAFGTKQAGLQERLNDRPSVLIYPLDAFRGVRDGCNRSAGCEDLLQERLGLRRGFFFDLVFAMVAMFEG